MVPLFGSNATSVRTEKEWIGWELFGNRAVRQGEWQLFNLREDPRELHDLSKQHPDQLKAMLALWDEYVKTNGVILSGDGPFAKGGESPAAKAGD